MKWLKRLIRKINNYLFPNGIEEELERIKMIDFFNSDDWQGIFTKEERDEELKFLSK